MAKGDGCIIEKRRGVFEVQVSLGKDPFTGKYRKASQTVYGTKRDAKRVRDKMRQDHENGLRVDAGKVTLQEFCEEYITLKRATGKANENTINRDASRLDLICNFIGNIPLRKLDARAIEAVYPKIRELREGQGKSCGNTAIHAYHVILKAVLKKAVDYDLILRNPCDRVDVPSPDTAERRALSAEEATRLLECIDQAEKDSIQNLLEKEQRQQELGNEYDRDFLLGMCDISYLLCVRLGLATGMRLGEALALPWGNIDFTNSRIRITQALDCKGNIKEPKTKAGKRSIFVDASTLSHLSQWKNLQADLLETLCIMQDDGSPVLCSATGDYLDKANFERWWRRFRSSVGFNELKFHELRHTQATQLLANGVDVKTVQARLGHAKASLTLDCYAHAIPENDAVAARLIGELFSPQTPSYPAALETA